MSPILREIQLRWYIIAIVIIGLFIALADTPDAALNTRELDPFKSTLGWQITFSFLRMFIAFVCALFTAITFGCLAATNKARAAVILPVVDILQSVPLLGFFPTAIYWFIKVGPDRIGIEMAVIFLIFTSQAWNLIFATYDGIRSIPESTLEATRAMGLGPFARFGRLYLPAAFPRIVDNAALSWANGWYFLMACEIIALGPLSFEVDGLGSYMFRNIHQGHWMTFYQGLLTLFAVIVFMDIFIWRPLSTLAKNFRFDNDSPSEDTSQTAEEMLSFYRHGTIATPLRMGLRYSFWFYKKLESFFDEKYNPEKLHTKSKADIAEKIISIAFWLTISVVLLWSTKEVIEMLLSPHTLNALNICLAIFLSGLRVLGAYFLCLTWILPLCFWLHRRAAYMRWTQSAAQILAAIPATAFFPIIALLSFRFFESTEAAVILMLITGMQWYLLFNLIGGSQGIGGDIKDLGLSLGLSRRLYIKKIFLPAVAPALITGSITAIGGGWNALIIAEYIGIGDKIYKVFGIGSIISEATFESGDKNLVAYALFFMVFFIVSINKLFWHPLYSWAEDKFRMDA